MTRSNRWYVLLLSAGVAAGAGCVSVKAPERINFQPHSRVADPSEVPPTYSHEEARERLAEAYGEIRYLRDKVHDLEEDKRELKRERDHYKRRSKD